MSENVHFSANQIAAIEWLATSKYDRHPPTQEMLAERLGITPRTITRWKQDDDFMAAVTALARKFLKNDLAEMYAALSREAKAGSYQHLKLAMEMTGEYTEKQHVEHSGKIDSDVSLNVSDLDDNQLNKLLEAAEKLHGA